MPLPVRTQLRNSGEYLNVPDVANLLKFHERTVLRYLIAGLIPGKKIGTKWRCKRSEIDKFMSSQ